MGCPSCGAENPPAAKFCEECGTRLPRRCPSCGHEVGATAKFCLECGERLEGASRSVPTPPAATSPQDYTPKHLADRILAGRAELEGERKQVTVLFADVVGSTELIRDLDPEDARALLEPAVSAMLSAVHRFEGTVCRVMGDGIMALFGAPIAHEDHAARACYAALTMQDAIRQYGQSVRERQGIEVLARVGLNSGEVVVGSISNDLYVEYSAIGPTTHLAARMEQLAVPGTVRLTVETLRLVEGLVDATSLGWIPVKGLAEPIEAFELLGAGPTRRRFQAAAARGLTPFVGRHAELEALQRALDLAASGHGQVVAPVGEPGVGKSRLFYEFVHSRRTDGWLVLESGSVSYGKATLWLPVIDLLKAYCRIDASDDARTAREKLVGKLLTLDDSLRSTLPALSALLDVPIEDPSWQALDPPQRRQASLDAVRRLLLRESQEQPLLLVFEDLHWIDSETQSLLDGLVEALPTARILLLVNYRPEYTHTWSNKSYYSQLRIDPLGEAGAQELLDALLGADPAIRPLASLLVGRTAGNPFFLEESVRTLVETGALVGGRGAYRLTRPVDEIRVPATVQAVLAARIDRLPGEQKRLLQTAAVIGKDVPFRLLADIAALAEADLQAGLSRLQAAELLYAVNLFPDLEYTFKHALTHEVAYGGLLQERRRALHARVVEAIERLYEDRLDEQVERLSHHALQGQDWEKAVRYAWQAAQRAAGRSANREAAVFFEQALAALRHLPTSRSTQEQAIDIRLELRNVLLQLNDFPAMFDHLCEAEALALALDDRRRLAWVSGQQTAFYFNTNRHLEAEAAGRRALEIANELDDFPLQLQAHFMLGLMYLCVCDYRQSAGFLTWHVDALQGELAYERFTEPGLPAVFSRSYLLRALAEVGEFDQGVARAEEALALATSADLPFTLGSALEGIGFLHLRRGAVQEAFVALERGLRLCEEWQLHLVHYPTAAYLGSAYALAGRDAEALPLLELAARENYGFHPSLWKTMLGEAHLLAGRLAEAADCTEQALARGEATGETGNRAWTLRLQAEIAARQELPDMAKSEARFREALTIAGEFGMRPLQAHCHLGLGKLYRLTDRPDEARAELSTAVAMLREMGMAFWLPEAERELAEAGG